MTDKPLIYIAGPYTNPDPVLNTHNAIKWAEDVESLGADVAISHLSLLWHIVCPAPMEKWYSRDLAVLARCDACFRFPGASSGADAEVKFANERDIPVLYSIEEAAAWMAHR